MPAWPRNVEEGAAGHCSPGLQIGTLSIKLSSYFIKLSYKGDLAGGSKVLGEDRHEPAGPPRLCGPDCRSALPEGAGTKALGPWLAECPQDGLCHDPRILAQRWIAEEEARDP